MLTWNLIVFSVCLVVGLILCLGSVLSGSYDVAHPDEIPSDLDHPEGDLDHHGSPHLGSSWITYLGGGQIPLGLVISISLVGFGAVGWGLSILLIQNGSNWVGPLSMLGACCYLVTLNRKINKTIGRYFPSYETHSVTPASFILKDGVALTDINKKGGCVRAYDDKKNYQILSAKTDGTPIVKGETVVIVGYDKESGTYEVVPEPQ